METVSNPASESRAELEKIIAGRTFTKEQLNAVQRSILRGEIDTVAHAAACGIALAVQIIRAHEQQEKRPGS